MVVPASLGVRRPGEPFVFSDEIGEDGENSFLVRTLWSGFSAGTELALVKGTYPHVNLVWDSRLDVFASPRSSPAYPVRTMGYMEVAEVVESGSPDVPRGQLLSMCYGHRTFYRASRTSDHHFPIPGSLAPELGIFMAQMAPVSVNAMLHAAAEVERPVVDLGAGVRNRRVLVLGAGVVGLLTALLALDLGAADVVVCDSRPHSLRAAKGLGLDALDAESVEPWRSCKERWANDRTGRGADVVFQCSGRYEALSTAFRAARRGATIIDLGFYQGAASNLFLGHEFHLNGLVHRCAQVDRPPEYGGDWTRRQLVAVATDFLVRHGSALSSHLLTHRVRLREAPSVIHEMSTGEVGVVQLVIEMAE